MSQCVCVCTLAYNVCMNVIVSRCGGESHVVECHACRLMMDIYMNLSADKVSAIVQNIQGEQQDDDDGSQGITYDEFLEVRNVTERVMCWNPLPLVIHGVVLLYWCFDA